MYAVGKGIENDKKINAYEPEEGKPCARNVYI
jgi:hypothetical protein